MSAWAVFGKKYKLASHLTQLGVAKLIRSEHSSQVHAKRISTCLQLRGCKIKPLVNAASVKHAALIQRVVSAKARNEPAEGREGGVTTRVCLGASVRMVGTYLMMGTERWTSPLLVSSTGSCMM